MVIGLQMSCIKKPMRASTRFFFAPVERSSTASTEAAPSARQRSERCEPTKPAPPRTTTCLPCIDEAMACRYSPRVELDLVESGLAGQNVLVLLEHQIDSLADVLSDRNLRLLVQELEHLVLLWRDVDRRGDLLARHERM